jgi:osmotically-inducible protein OsmY
MAVAAHVRSALRQDPRTNKLQVSIAADNGVVTLAGLADHGQDPKDAADVATKVQGVKDVVNQLRPVATSARHIVEG